MQSIPSEKTILIPLNSPDAVRPQTEALGTPHDSFRQICKSISDHRFVTDETTRKREDLRRFLEQTQSQLREKGYPGSLLCIPFGSIALGKAREESDWDGLLFYIDQSQLEFTGTKSTNVFPAPLKLYAEFDAIKKDVTLAQHLEIISLSYILHSVFPIKNLHLPETHEDFSDFIDDHYTLACCATLFAPTLREYSDEKEHEQIQKIRKQFLELLVTQPEDVEKTWESIRSYLTYFFLRNDDIPSYEEGKQAERKQRTVDVLTSVIREWGTKTFSLDEKRQKAVQRATTFINNRRLNIRYPTLREILVEFGVPLPPRLKESSEALA